MTGQTPIALWDPALAKRSLPSGMPLTEPSIPEEATLLDGYAIKGLSSNANAVLWPGRLQDAAFRTFELYPQRAPTLFVTPSTISPDVLAAYSEIGWQIDLANRGISVKYVTPHEPSHAIKLDLGLSSALIRESLERLRRELRLSARVVARLIGVSTRRYYEFRAGDVPPAARLAEISDRIDFIKGLAARDLPAAAELCRRDGAAIAGFLSEGRLTEVEALFRATVHERATMLAPEERPDISGLEASDLLAIVEGPAFRKVLRLVRFLAPAVDARTTDRAAAALRMEKNIHAVEIGDPVEDDWEFLLVMQPDAIAGLRERADTILRGEAFDLDAWTAFVAGESERAWGAFDYRPAAPLDPEPPEEAPAAIDAGGWQPDLVALGVDLSLYDRRAR